MTTIHLIRHGDVHNPDKILYGRIPGFRLSDKGRQQAQSAAEHLTSRITLAALYASPQQRAQETAGFIASAQGNLNIRTDARLDECLTPHEGRPQRELAAENWDLYTGNEPPYETVDDMLKRALDFVAFARDQHVGESVAAVTHGDIVVFTFMHFKRIDSNLKDRMALYQHGISDQYPATASITTLTFGDGDWPDVAYLRPY